MYAVKEFFVSLQGEGFYVGRTAVFCRFSGCNLWSGREEDRAGALCGLCDTDFKGTDGPGGGVFTAAEDLAQALLAAWDAASHDRAGRFAILTGGEPLLQVDAALLDALHARGFFIAVETNGTRPLPEGLDWVTVSPKAGAPLLLTTGDELKLVYPQKGLLPQAVARLSFRHFFLQPKDGPDKSRNLQEAIALCLQHPQWRLSVQLHKYIGIP